MTELTIDLKEFESVQRALDRLTDEAFTEFGHRATYQTALEFQGVIRQSYPPSPRKVKWKSREQRIAYIIMRRENGYPLQYTRGSDPMSQNLKDWAIDRGKDSATLGTRATYAPYVMAEGYQTEMHKSTGWETIQQIIAGVRRSGVIDKIVKSEIARALKKAFRGQ